MRIVCASLLLLLLGISNAWAQTTSCAPLVNVPGIGGGGYTGSAIVAPGSTVRIEPNNCQFSSSYSSVWSPGGQTTSVATVPGPAAGTSQAYTLTATSGSQVKTG